MADEKSTPDSEGQETPETPEAPDQLKWLLWGWHHLQKEWVTLMKGPVLAAVVVVGLAAYFYGRSISSEEISVKDERPSFAAEQIAAYKDRLQGASPDEAAKQLSDLKSQLNNANSKLEMLLPDNPRHLMDSEKAYLLKNMAKIKDDVGLLLIYAWVSGDAPEYANEFAQFFTSNNMPNAGPISASCETRDRGVLVGLVDPEKPSDKAIDFTNILKEAGFSVGHTNWSRPNGVVAVSGTVPNQTPVAVPDFDLFICGGN